ncbi:MAG: iron-containing alcohol dehydrogenase, partial [Hyphomicrobiaceae bacterium]|nr:iron-containing alcohol dehydrogenase [Hyphomicrobiaceae bacterium]
DAISAKRVFITSTQSLTKFADGPLQKIEAALGTRHAGTFTAIGAHSPREGVIAGAKAARDAGADLIVAVGGGSVIDATKAMLMCVWLGLETPEAMEPYREDQDRNVRTPPVPPADPVRMISVSTTLSAAEFTPRAGVTESSTHTKQAFAHRLFAPRVVILDPSATLNTPEWLLYCTGIRAVDHAVESFCSKVANPATEPLSLQGLKLLHRSLPAIKADPAALAPRLEAQFGMWQAISGSTAGAGAGASHGIGYALGATFGIPHGHTSCIMLPAVLKWNEPVNGDRQKALSTAMGAPDRPACELIAELVAGLDQPGNLRAAGVTRDQLGEIAKRAMHYAPVRRNPRPIKSPDDVMEILELAW